MATLIRKGLRPVKEHDCQHEDTIVIRRAPKPRPVVCEIPPVIFGELVLFIESKGHYCMNIISNTNHEFHWCQKDQCTTPEFYSFTEDQANV